MSQVDISINIGARIGATLREFGSRVPLVREILDGVLLDWRAELLNIWPEDTGTSLRAWESRIDGLRLILRNPVDYAEYVHVSGDKTPLWLFLRAQAEAFVQAVIPRLLQLLAEVQRERDSQGLALVAAGPTFAANAGPSSGLSLFAATAAAFQRVGARQRLRERFPNEPIGRAATRRRDRPRVR